MAYILLTEEQVYSKYDNQFNLKRLFLLFTAKSKEQNIAVVFSDLDLFIENET